MLNSLPLADLSAGRPHRSTEPKQAALYPQSLLHSKALQRTGKIAKSSLLCSFFLPLVPPYSSMSK